MRTLTTSLLGLGALTVLLSLAPSARAESDSRCGHHSSCCGSYCPPCCYTPCCTPPCCYTPPCYSPCCPPPCCTPSYGQNYGPSYGQNYSQNYNMPGYGQSNYVPGSSSYPGFGSQDYRNSHNFRVNNGR